MKMAPRRVMSLDHLGLKAPFTTKKTIAVTKVTKVTKETKEGKPIKEADEDEEQASPLLPKRRGSLSSDSSSYNSSHAEGRLKMPFKKDSSEHVKATHQAVV